MDGTDGKKHENTFKIT